MLLLLQRKHNSSAWPRATRRLKSAQTDPFIFLQPPPPRFLLFLMQKDPLMEFAARPLPPDQLSFGVPEQAK